MEDVETRPLTVVFNVVPTTFDCVAEADNVVVELSVAVHVTLYSPTAAGVKIVVDPLVVLNSLVLTVPFGLVELQL